ncbi:MAG: ATP-binding cassette domain-containing protein [Rhodanobacteraceae bacterium]
MTVLEVSALSKRFGGLQAVHQMSFAVSRGEVLGLIGPNGSGKSTTLAMTMGVIRPDSGSVKLQGREVAMQPIHRIAKVGIAMVFQHSRPLRRQTVLENIKLALLPNALFQLAKDSEVTAKARQAAELVGLREEELRKLPGALPFASLRRLEIAKVLARDPLVILFDEPFAGLAPSETRELADLIVSLRKAGRAMVLVDHNVKAITGLADRIAVMHAGEKIAEGTPEEITRNVRVREVYFGKSQDVLIQRNREPSHEITTTQLLDVDIKSVRYGRAEALRGIQLHVSQGEFVSVVGINGAGKTTLLNSILGFVEYNGDIRWQGQSLRGRSPASIALSGMALCPETRELFPYMSVRDNLALGAHALDAKERREQLERVFALFPVLHQRARQSARTLSGGEQQMLTIGRALMQKPRLLMLDEPTLGLAPLILDDISVVLNTLQQESGLTVLLAEQNITFALRHSDRIYLVEAGSLHWHGTASRFSSEVGAKML